MNRRDALKIGVLGTAFLTSSGVLAACAREASTADDDVLLEAMADTLLPTTASSPGAKAAGARQGIRLLLADCYEPPAQQRVADGLRAFRARHADFASRPQAERERVLRDLDAEAKRAGDAHWFHLVRELSERAYFSSEIGMTRALRYVRIPGRWVGCVPLAPGQPAWG